MAQQHRKKKKEAAAKANEKKKLGIKGILLYVIILFLFQETVIRLCFPLPELQNFNRINYQILDRQASGPGFLRNIDMTWRSTMDTTATFVHQFNAYGYRDEDWKMAKPSGKKRIFFVGDSFVEGMMSDQDKTIVEGFKQAAGSEADNWEIFNCGMMGIGLNEYMKFLADAVPIFKPDEVYMVLYSNDIPFQRDYKPQVVLSPVEYGFFTPRLKVVIEHIQANDPIPFRWNRPVQPFYNAVPDPGNPWTSREKEMAQHVTPEMATEMKLGNFNFFRANWILEEKKFLSQKPKNIAAKFKFIKNYLAKHGTALKVFYIPSRSQVTDYYYQYEKQACLVNCPDTLSLTGEEYQIHQKLLTNVLKKLEVEFHDLTDFVKKKEAKGQRLYWNFDDHMRGSSYLMLGNEIYNRQKGR